MTYIIELKAYRKKIRKVRALEDEYRGKKPTSSIDGFGDSETPDLFANHEQRVDAYFRHLLEERRKRKTDIQWISSRTLPKGYFNGISEITCANDLGTRVIRFPKLEN